MIGIAQVIDTKPAFKPTLNVTSPNKGNFPLGTIKVRSISSNGPVNEYYARPAWNINYVPAIGEHVITLFATEDFQIGSSLSKVYYYLGPINIHGNINLNPLPDIYTLPNGSPDYNISAAPIKTSTAPYRPGENLKENANVKNLQIFEGDILFQGRHGQAIRFSSTQAGDTSQYAVKPFWQGKGGSPITIISNGHKPESGPNRYVIEDPKTTKSFLILSTDQRIDFNASQQSIGTGVTPISNYTKSQAILSSERLIFNSTDDEIIICGKKTVNIVTPKWQMDMDKLFTLLEETLQQLADLTSGKAQFQTPMGGPTLTATNVTEVQKLLTELKTMKQ